jgi:lipopolysaccharide export system protein LptC
VILLRILAAAAVIGLLAVGWLALHSQQSGPAAPATASTYAQSPGYSARDAVLIETGADGRPMYTLRAAEIRQQPGAQVAVLDQVRMQFRDAAGNLWQGRADQGRVLGDASLIDLSGMVAISGQLPGAAMPAEIESDRLSVDVRREIVTTSDEVTIDWDGQQLRARGLVARLREQRLKLESSVHGTYRP